MIYKPDIIYTGRELLDDFALRIRQGIIIEMAPSDRIRPEGEKVQVLRGVMFLPAFINAHTHLDLSHLRGKLAPGSRFGEWLTSVAKARMLSPFESKAVRKGIASLATGGSAAVADISVSGKSAHALHQRGMHGSVVFLETFGLNPAKAQKKAAAIERRIESLEREACVRIGISPHSPYSVSPELFAECRQIAERLGLPLCIHAAETSAEVELLKSGTGELANLLKKYNLLPPGWKPPGTTPIRYLRDLGILESRPLLVHCNYVDDEEAEIIADSGCIVVYCPRSNAFFRRPEDSCYRLAAAGVKLVLGTDSLASNNTLSILDEMRFLKQRHPDFGWEEILRMASFNAAEALDIPRWGIIEPGRPADITAIRPGSGSNISQRIFSEGAEVVFTMNNGEQISRHMRRAPAKA